MAGESIRARAAGEGDRSGAAADVTATVGGVAAGRSIVGSAVATAIGTAVAGAVGLGYTVEASPEGTSSPPQATKRAKTKAIANDAKHFL